MPHFTQGKRAQRTRKALIGAFNGLLFERGYPGIRVDHVVDRAQVGRSTLYEHFRGKEAILGSSVQGALGVVADSIGPQDNTERLAALFTHFWEQRLLARDLLTGTAGRKIRNTLVSLVEQRLDAASAGRADPLSIPRHLVAVHLAHGMLAPLTAWLLGEAHCSARALAAAVRGASRASLQALGG